MKPLRTLLLIGFSPGLDARRVQPRGQPYERRKLADVIGFYLSYWFWLGHFSNLSAAPETARE